MAIALAASSALGQPPTPPTDAPPPLAAVAAGDDARNEALRRQMDEIGRQASQLLLNSHEERLVMGHALTVIAQMREAVAAHDEIVVAVQRLEAECRGMRELAVVKRDESSRLADAYEQFHATCVANLEKARAEVSLIRGELVSLEEPIQLLQNQLAYGRKNLEEISRSLEELERRRRKVAVALQ